MPIWLFCKKWVILVFIAPTLTFWSEEICILNTAEVTLVFYNVKSCLKLQKKQHFKNDQKNVFEKKITVHVGEQK